MALWRRLRPTADARAKADKSASRRMRNTLARPQPFSPDHSTGGRVGTLGAAHFSKGFHRLCRLCRGLERFTF